MFCSFSPSGPLEEMVEVPVVPELGEGCQEEMAGCVGIDGSAPGGSDLLTVWQHPLCPEVTSEQHGVVLAHT